MTPEDNIQAAINKSIKGLLAALAVMSKKEPPEYITWLALKGGLDQEELNRILEILT